MFPGLPVQAWLSEKRMHLFFPRRPALPGWVGWLWGKDDQSWLGLPPSPGSSGVMVCTAGVRHESKGGCEEMSYWGATFRLEAIEGLEPKASQ